MFEIRDGTGLNVTLLSNKVVWRFRKKVELTSWLKLF
jgi:hypothetical protein